MKKKKILHESPHAMQCSKMRKRRRKKLTIIQQRSGKRYLAIFHSLSPIFLSQRSSNVIFFILQLKEIEGNDIHHLSHVAICKEKHPIYGILRMYRERKKGRKKINRNCTKKLSCDITFYVIKVLSLFFLMQVVHLFKWQM